jgi:hypothetical protein
VSWDVLRSADGVPALFTGAEGERTLDVVVKSIRVRAQGVSPAMPAPVMTFGAGPALAPNLFTRIDPPLVTGSPGPIDLGLNTGPLKTVVARGPGLGRGGRVTVLASMDGAAFDEAFFFDRDGQGVQSERIIARYFQVRRDGLGEVTVTLGAEGLFEGNGSEDVFLSAEGRATTLLTEDVLAAFQVPLAAARSARLFVTLAARIRLPTSPDPVSTSLLRVRLGGDPSQPDGDELLEIPIPTGGKEVSLDGVSMPFARPAEPGSIIKVTALAPNGLELPHLGVWIRGA